MFDQRRGDSPGFSTGTAGACEEDCVSCTPYKPDCYQRIQSKTDIYEIRHPSTGADVCVQERLQVEEGRVADAGACTPAVKCTGSWDVSVYKAIPPPPFCKLMLLLGISDVAKGTVCFCSLPNSFCIQLHSF